MALSHLVDTILNVIVFALIGVMIWLYLRREENDIE